jgi:hypothetical protein
MSEKIIDKLENEVIPMIRGILPREYIRDAIREITRLTAELAAAREEFKLLCNIARHGFKRIAFDFDLCTTRAMAKEAARFLTLLEQDPLPQSTQAQEENAEII